MREEDGKVARAQNHGRAFRGIEIKAHVASGVEVAVRAKVPDVDVFDHFLPGMDVLDVNVTLVSFKFSLGCRKRFVRLRQGEQTFAHDFMATVRCAWFECAEVFKGRLEERVNRSVKLRSIEGVSNHDVGGLVAIHAGIDLASPSVNSAANAGDIGQTLGSQEVRHVETASTVVAENENMLVR